MAFDKDEIKQLKNLLYDEIPKVVQPMLDQQSTTLMYDVKVLVRHELISIKKDLEWVKNKLKDIEEMEDEDIVAAFKDIEFLKKQIKTLEVKIQTLELSRK